MDFRPRAMMQPATPSRPRMKSFPCCPDMRRLLNHVYAETLKGMNWGKTDELAASLRLPGTFPGIRPIWGVLRRCSLGCLFHLRLPNPGWLDGQSHYIGSVDAAGS